MRLVFRVFDGSNWLDRTEELSSLQWSISGQELESLKFTLIGEDIKTGHRVRLVRGHEVVFEGVTHQVDRRHESGRARVVEATACSDLILWDRHIVYREYPAGTKAGTIIKDLASLEPGTDTAGVDEHNTPSLTAPWFIENAKALKVMLDVARGTNYYIRIKPGKKLLFKPKRTGTPKLTLSSSNTVSAEYSEDRWMLRDRVIYVGAGGRVLADVSEGEGESPLIVHDPFLTDESEAQRRAGIRLDLCKEYGRRLRVRVHGSLFEDSGLELFDTVRVNLPSLNLTNTDMFIVGVSYEPADGECDLEIGGRLEYLEDFLQEALGGDVAARFGQAVKVPELVSTLYTVTEAVGEGLKTMSTLRYPVYSNRPPLTLYNSNNVTLDPDGCARLVSGATEGSFEASVLPASPLFTAFIKAEWVAEGGQGRVSAEILDSSGNVITRVVDAVDTQQIYAPRWPRALGWITRKAASSWGGSGAAASDVWAGIINSSCLKLAPATQGVEGEIFYPAAKNLNLDIDFARYMRLYFYGDYAADFSVKIRLHTDASNYREGVVTVKHDTWAKYELALSTFTRVGNPSAVNWISILSPRNLLIDSDYVFLSFIREQIRVRYKLSRNSAAQTSPKIRWVKIIWREGDYG
ncbi:MAG: hypothetical protein QXO86_03445 [Nitrososphaerota archaeon]